jgi:alkaline phosphatase D
VKQNDFVKWYTSNRGYVSCELTKDHWKSYFHATPFVTKKGSPVETKAAFIIEDGKPAAQLVSGA